MTKHIRLVEDLALSLDTIYVNVPCGSVWQGQYRCQTEFRKSLQLDSINDAYEVSKGKGTPIADVLTVKPSYTRFCILIYEVKVSRSDFLSDIRSEKWKMYLPHCHRFYFATTSGIVKWEDIPPEAGWIVRGDKGWRVNKATKNRDTEVDGETLLSLIFYKQKAPKRLRRLKMVEWIKHGSYDRKKTVAKIVGKEIAEAWAQRDKWERARADLRYRIEKIRTAINDGLGINEEFPEWELEKFVRQIKEKADNDHSSAL